MNKEKSGLGKSKAVSFLGKAGLVLALLAAASFLSAGLLFAATFADFLWPRKLVEAPTPHINDAPTAQYRIKLTPVDEEMIVRAASGTQVTYTLASLSRENPCMPRRYQTGTDYPSFPVKILVATTVSGSDAEFIATFDYFRAENFYGKGSCQYRIDGAWVQLDVDAIKYNIYFSRADLDEFLEHPSNTFSCRQDQEIKRFATEKQHSATCRIYVGELSAEQMKHKRLFVATAAEI